MNKKISRSAKTLLGLAAAAAIAWGAYHFMIKPGIDRWGATEAEVAARLPGDDLVAQPVSVVNRAVTIQARPEQIYPWLVQLGAEKGGMYSYTVIETNLLRCPLVNADRIHPEWQNLKVGDLVKMCPGSSGPPAYQAAALEPNRAMILGHQNPDGSWADSWQFVISPQADSSSRLIVRTRSTMSGALWDIIHPGVFVMESGMLLGIKSRAEQG